MVASPNARSADAKSLGENINTMYVAFSSAFNATDHDELLIVMYDLGFPMDCIEAVKNLYQSAETTLPLSGGGQ